MVLVALRPRIDSNLISLFVGEQEVGKAKRAFRIRQAGETAEPSRERPDCPETERIWPFAAEDASGMLNDSPWPRNKANMPSSLPSADNASALVSLFRSEAQKYRDSIF
jgi:hypothetical protein